VTGLRLSEGSASCQLMCRASGNMTSVDNFGHSAQWVTGTSPAVTNDARNRGSSEVSSAAFSAADHQIVADFRHGVPCLPLVRRGCRFAHSSFRRRRMPTGSSFGTWIAAPKVEANHGHRTYPAILFRRPSCRL
jgi:hypothetical protein